MPLSSASCPAFVVPNADGAGYYRFSLDADGWRGLMANFGRLNEKEALAAADSLAPIVVQQLADAGGSPQQGDDTQGSPPSTNCPSAIP